MISQGDVALVILPPAEVRLAVDVWRKRHDPHIETIPPHITVVYPLVLKAEDWHDKKPGIRACLRAFQPFSVHLQATGVFESPASVLWLRPDDGGVIAAIRAALASQFPEAVPPLPFNFIPHVTLGFFDTVQALHQAQITVERELSPMTFEVNAISYLLQAADGGWCESDTVAIG